MTFESTLVSAHTKKMSSSHQKEKTHKETEREREGQPQGGKGVGCEEREGRFQPFKIKTITTQN